MGIIDTNIPAMNFYAKGIRVYSNVQSAKLYSADLQMLYNPIKSLSIFLNSKFTVGELYTGVPMPLIPPLKNIVAIQYQKNQFSLQTECESSMAQSRINKDYGERKTPAFTVLNIKSGYSIPLFKRTMDIGLGISNLFNKVYFEHLDWGRINRSGRSLELFLKISY